MRLQALKGLLRQCLSRRVVPHTIRGGPLKGTRIVTSWHDYPAGILGRTESSLLQWFADNARPSETWLDLGAHYGYTAIALARLVGRDGRVFAFEPMLSTAGSLAQTRVINRLAHVTVLPFALGAEGPLKLAKLPTVRGMVDSTLTRHGGNEDGREAWCEGILVASLDWLWPHMCGTRERIDGVKVDVQGMEVEVLLGMTSLLRRWKPRLAVEVHSGVNRRRLLDALEGAGYGRRGTPIEAQLGEREEEYIDDRSYAFMPIA